jgi:hypothetical protein
MAIFFLMFALKSNAAKSSNLLLAKPRNSLGDYPGSFLGFS